MVDMEAIMAAAIDEDRETLAMLLESLDDNGRAYMHGYLQGYADASKSISEGGLEIPGFNKAQDSDRMAT